MCRSPDPGYEWSQNGYGDGSSSKKTAEVAAGLLEDFLRASEVNLLKRQLRLNRLLCDRDGVAGSEGEAVIGGSVAEVAEAGRGLSRGRASTS